MSFVASALRPHHIVPGKVNLTDLRSIYNNEVKLILDKSAIDAIDAAQQTVEDIITSGKVVYGINSGFGKLANCYIPKDCLARLQRNLVLSHSAGIGELLPDNVLRLIVACKVISLARGHSGIRFKVVQALMMLYNAGVMPCIPEKGSVGASGDLAPLAHMSLMLLGEGQVRLSGGRLVNAVEGLALTGLEPIELAPKEGLALLNGTQVSNSLALAGLFEAERVFSGAMVAGVLSLEAIKGSAKPFDARIHEARGQSGQIAVASAVRSLLEGSQILLDHVDCGRVQDPYSIRCIAQVMGSCLDNLHYAARILSIEANAASDNPLVFSDTGEVISGGNFHAEPVAFAADIIALAVAEIGAISERRLALLMDRAFSRLPEFLVADAGLNSGFMIPQVTAAALVSENKSLAHPSSVDSIPTSANQEDHVSMATYAARRLRDMCFNASIVVGIEAMAAAQGMDFNRPLVSSSILEDQHQGIRERLKFLEQDRLMARDIDTMRMWVVEQNWPDPIKALLPSYSCGSVKREKDCIEHAVSK